MGYTTRMIHAIAQPNYWTFTEALQQTPEEAALYSHLPDIVAKFGFSPDYDFRPAISLGNVVMKCLMIQRDPTIARDWWDRFADYQSQNLVIQDRTVH